MTDHDEQTVERYMFTIAVCSSILGGGIGATANEAGADVLTEIFAPVGMVIILWCIASLIHKTLEYYYDD